jgi:2-polyprenyl-3-methyl-5-hydroxy-6-metoxy-1,4-benzoquinol methylase
VDIIKPRRNALLGKRDRIFDEIEAAIDAPASLLDIGCGSDSPVQFLHTRPPRLVGVDGFMPSIEKSRARNIHDGYVCIDLDNLGDAVEANSFDCVLAIDVIEHFEKEQGLALIRNMEKIAKRRVVLLTPNGFLPQEAHSGNPYQEHRSGWSVQEMRSMGFEVIGVNGWKPLLGQFAQPRFWPAPLWRVLSRLSQPLIRNRPEHAFHLLCVKKLG